MTPDTIDFNSLSKKQLVELVIKKYNDCFRLEEENKKLKSDLHFERNMLDNVRAEYESLQNVIKNLEEELEWYKEHYEHEIDKEVLKGFGCEIANED